MTEVSAFPHSAAGEPLESETILLPIGDEDLVPAPGAVNDDHFAGQNCHLASHRPIPGGIMNLFLRSIATISTLLLSVASAQDYTRIGVASIDITPDGPIRLTGYGSRTTESEGVEQHLFARALAIGSDAEGPAVLLAVDNLGIPASVVNELAHRLERRASIQRERLAVCSTHTHTGPAVGDALPIIFGGPLPPDQKAHIDAYTKTLTDRLEVVALDAIKTREPGRLAWSRGTVPFAANRRVLKDGKWTGFGVNPDGPTDHDLSILTVRSQDDRLRAVLVNYACHCTTLEGNFNKVHGDWAGVASQLIERENPGAKALIVIGCGADANPEPRGKLEQAEAHGETIAAEVRRLLSKPLRPIEPRLIAKYREIDLPFDPAPSADHWKQQAEKPGAVGYHAKIQLERLARGESLQSKLDYPVQTWVFGSELAMVFLAGEVVVDIGLRLKKECDADRLWVTAYTNDVPCYIPSDRILREGGYEAESSLLYYDRPARLSVGTEARISDAVREMLPAKMLRNPAP
jgi:Neutral/alkaline non-lysosomal ceramidase, N-terminal